MLFITLEVAQPTDGFPPRAEEGGTRLLITGAKEPTRVFPWNVPELAQQQESIGYREVQRLAEREKLCRPKS